MSALQSRPAIQVAPFVFVVQTVVPVVLAPLLFGEFFSQTPYGGVPLACALILLLIGATMLARSPLLLALMAGQRVPSTAEVAQTPADNEGLASARAESLPAHRETWPPAGGDVQAAPAREPVSQSTRERVSESSDTTPRPRASSADTIRSSPRTEASDPSAVTTSTSPARAGR